MKRAIDSAHGRRLYSQRIGTVQPVFGNIRHNKRMTRQNLRGRERVNAQWHPLLHGAQHREAGQQRVEAVRGTWSQTRATNPQNATACSCP